MQHSLTDDDLRQYRADGYLVVERLFDVAWIARADAAINEICRQADAGGATQELLEWELESVSGELLPRRIYNPFHQHATFREIATSAELLGPIKQILGPDVNLHHSKLNMKPANVGSVVDWHQDLAYFPHTNDDLVTTLVYLDEATEKNGCLEVLPGCHDRYYEHAGPDGRFSGRITEPLEPDQVGDPQPLPAPAGSAILMHARLPHSSQANRSDKPRRTLIFEYRAADALPIFYSERAAQTEALSVHLCGEKARYARFGGPPPYIPVLDGTKSLYDLQAEARKREDATQ